MLRVLVLCTHNSARSQMAEGLTRKAAQSIGFDLDVFSAGTEATSVKANAVTVTAELGIDLSAASSKTLFDLPDPWNFDYVVTVCDRLPKPVRAIRRAPSCGIIRLPIPAEAAWNAGARCAASSPFGSQPSCRR